MTDTKNEAAGGASLSDAGLGAEPRQVAQYCTFCGSRDDEVQLLIACYAAMICDHCVQICNEILTEKEIPLMAQAAEVAAEGEAYGCCADEAPNAEVTSRPSSGD